MKLSTYIVAIALAVIMVSLAYSLLPHSELALLILWPGLVLANELGWIATPISANVFILCIAVMTLEFLPLAPLLTQPTFVRRLGAPAYMFGLFLAPISLFGWVAKLQHY